MPSAERNELVEGRLVPMSPVNADHARLVAQVTYLLKAHLKHRPAGIAVVEMGFTLTSNPDTVRGPDVAFVRRARVPAEPPQSFWPFGPDLAVEVVSPSNSISELHQNVIDYFDAGAELVWVIDRNIRTATVYRSLTDTAILREHETLDSGELLPGFVIALSELSAPGTHRRQAWPDFGGAVLDSTHRLHNPSNPWS